MRSLTEVAQEVSSGRSFISPLKTSRGGWSLYDKRQSVWADMFTSPQVAHVNHIQNARGVTPYWFNRIKSDFTLTGPFAYGGWFIQEANRFPDVGSLGFKVAFCHQANFCNYLLMVQQRGAVVIWKEDREREGGYGRTLASAGIKFQNDRPYHWRIEVDGKGGINVRVDNVEVTVKDDMPLYSGGLGFRLDRGRYRFADGIST